MPVDFYYKGLMDEDEHFRPHTPEKSAERAEGTMYEAWFDALKASHWYMAMCEGGEPPTNAAQVCFQNFGDIRPYSFKKWWMDVGYQIFAEQTRYEDVQVHEVSAKVKLKYNKKTGALNNLFLEIPTNIHPRKLREQFEDILEKHSRYFEHNNRFAESDAPVTFDRDSKLNYKTIMLWLKVYKLVEAERSKKHGASLAEICRDMELRPSLLKEFGYRTVIDDPEVKQKAASAVSDYYKKALRLIANATEMRFPCTEENEHLMQIRRRNVSDD